MHQDYHYNVCFDMLASYESFLTQLLAPRPHLAPQASLLAPPQSLLELHLHPQAAMAATLVLQVLQVLQVHQAQEVLLVRQSPQHLHRKRLQTSSRAPPPGTWLQLLRAYWQSLVSLSCCKLRKNIAKDAENVQSQSEARQKVLRLWDSTFVAQLVHENFQASLKGWQNHVYRLASWLETSWVVHESDWTVH